MAIDNSGPTLTNITRIGRHVVKFGLIGIVALMVGRMALGAFVAYWKATHPPPPPPPTVGFGVLPAPRFDLQDESDKPASYVLETATGGTPEFGDRAKVFFMPKAAANLLADEEAKAIAAQYGFVFEPEVVDSQTYRWTKTKPINSTLEMNIYNHSLTLTTDYLSHPELLVNNTLPTGFEAVQRIKSFLDQAELLPPDTATASGEILPLKSLGGTLDEAVSVSEADFLQVDLTRTPIDTKYRMFTPEGFKGTISGILTGSLQGRDAIVKLDFYHYQVDYTQVHTYPIRTSQSAWQLLQAGEGYIVNPGEQEQAVIRNVQLGYYDDFEEQEYLQPIYVFEGDDGFIGYVSAIDPKYLQNTP